MASEELSSRERETLFRFQVHLHLFRRALKEFSGEAAWGDAYMSHDYERHRNVAALERYFESVVNFGLGIEQTVLVHCGKPGAKDWTGEKLEPELVNQCVFDEELKTIAERLRKCLATGSSTPTSCSTPR